MIVDVVSTAGYFLSPIQPTLKRFIACGMLKRQLTGEVSKAVDDQDRECTHVVVTGKNKHINKLLQSIRDQFPQISIICRMTGLMPFPDVKIKQSFDKINMKCGDSAGSSGDKEMRFQNSEQYQTRYGTSFWEAVSSVTSSAQR
jgi:hypothetical protein